MWTRIQKTYPETDIGRFQWMNDVQMFFIISSAANLEVEDMQNFHHHITTTPWKLEAISAETERYQEQHGSDSSNGAAPREHVAVLLLLIAHAQADRSKALSEAELQYFRWAEPIHMEEGHWLAEIIADFKGRMDLVQAEEDKTRHIIMDENLRRLSDPMFRGNREDFFKGAEEEFRSDVTTDNPSVVRKVESGASLRTDDIVDESKK